MFYRLMNFKSENFFLLKINKIKTLTAYHETISKCSCSRSLFFLWCIFYFYNLLYVLYLIIIFSSPTVEKNKHIALEDECMRIFILFST
jgi:hypothetical protein